MEKSSNFYYYFLTKYYQFATADSGIAYVLYAKGSNDWYIPVNDADGKISVKDKRGTYYRYSSGSPVSPCHLYGSSSKVTPNLIIKNDHIDGIKFGTTATNTLKNTFSIYDTKKPDLTDDDEFLGTFTKTSIGEQITNVVGDNSIKKSTKYFESNSGDKYYNINTSGYIAGTNALAEMTSTVNNSLTVKGEAYVKMLEFYEAAEISDSVACMRYQVQNFSGNTIGSLLIEINVSLFKGIFELKTGMVQELATKANIA